MTYNAKAYAKVNLHLEVLNKRSDLYHNIFCFNASLDLFDRLTFKRLNVFNNTVHNISIDIQPMGGIYGDILLSVKKEDNLITKAIKFYFKRIRKSAEIIVSIEKNIPAAAGFGGASSDAASVLRFLNNYFIAEQKGLTESELLVLGASVGADVPYCLAGGYAICEGIGEIIEKIEGRLNYWILVANSGIIINTKDAYASLNRGRRLKLTKEEINHKKNSFRQGLQEGNISSFKGLLKNDFEEHAFSIYPQLKELKDEIAGFMPEYVTMTGSGSSIIGLFKDIKKAEIARDKLRTKARVFITRLL